MHIVSYKIKQFFFSNENTLYILSKDWLYEANDSNGWKIRLKKSFSGKGKVAIDMVEHDDKIIVILDNFELMIVSKDSTSKTDAIELTYNKDVTPTCMTKLGDNLIIGCTFGVIFNTKLIDLTKAEQLERPPFLGNNAAEPPEVKEYPDCRVIKSNGTFIWALFNDKTMLIYKVNKDGSTEVTDTIKSHFGAIYDIDWYPPTESAYQFGFLTGSTDRTLRRWIVNVDSKELTCKVNEDKIGLLCDNFDHLRKKNEVKEEDGFGRVRTIKLSTYSDLKHVVCGDSWGYIWVFDAINLGLVSINEVHQNEILAIEFAPIDDLRDSRHQIMATCSKDHSIKIFDAKKDYEEIKTIDDHQSAVIGLKWIEDLNDSDLKIVSADAKGMLSVRSVDEELNFSEPFSREVKDSKIFSVQNNENNFILGMEKKIQVGQILKDNSISLKKSVSPSTATVREYIKLEADDVSLYCIASSKKKRDVSFIEIKSGNVSQSFSCGEVITGIKFSPSYKFLITSTSTGCIFIWKVPSGIEREIMFKSNQKTLRITETPRNRDGIQSKSDGFASYFNDIPIKEERKFWGGKEKPKPQGETINTMPDWARSTVNVNDLGDDEEDNGSFSVLSKKNDPLAILRATVTDDEDSEEQEEEEEKHLADNSMTEDNATNHENSEGHSEVEDAFDFEQSKVRKQSFVNNDIINRGSRISNILRNSVYQKEQKRSTVSNNSGFGDIVSNEIPKSKKEMSMIKEEEKTKKSSKIAKEGINVFNIFRYG